MRRRRYTLTDYTAQLKAAQQRLTELTAQGNAAVFREDRRRAKQGEAQQALKLAKQRLRQRIDYYHFQIAKLTRQPEQLVLFSEDEVRPPVDDGMHGREAEAHPPTAPTET
jgi:apolipoprotein N-acyltransferase